MANQEPPRFLQSALWSYDLTKLDVDNPVDKEIIITQVLNHGDWQQLQWLLSTYRHQDLIEILSSPRRGLWVKDSLDYWINIFDLKIEPKKYEAALFDLNPHASGNT